MRVSAVFDIVFRRHLRVTSRTRVHGVRILRVRAQAALRGKTRVRVHFHVVEAAYRCEADEEDR